MQKESFPTSTSAHYPSNQITENLWRLPRIIQFINLLRRIVKNHKMKMTLYMDSEMPSKKELILSPFQSPWMRLRNQERILLMSSLSLVEPLLPAKVKSNDTNHNFFSQSIFWHPFIFKFWSSQLRISFR